MASPQIEKKIKKEPKYVPEYKCKRCKKSNTMWVEQVYLRMDALEKELEALKETVKYIYDFLDIKSKEENKVG